MAKDVMTGASVAIKCLSKASVADEYPTGVAYDDRSEELILHSRIGRHPNIVNLIHSFETEHHTYLVLEFCPNGDLYEAIRLGKGPLETEHVRDFMLQLVNAVDHIHSKGVYHRDIKPENIFLTQSGSMKLGDFGLATRETWSTEFAVGSDRYMSPEQYGPTSYAYGYCPAAADVWAIGICLLNVLFSRNPFAVPTQSDPLFADFVSDRQSLFDVFPTMSQDTFNVLTHCLAMDPERRSLSAVREALETVVSFTTDDDALDEFCTEDRDPVPATLNREPLRTPSITSPQIDSAGHFPWAKALQATPQKSTRQLSVIPDTESYVEDLFPEPRNAGKSWYATDPDATSLNSTLDSGLGMSYKSANVSNDHIGYASSRPVPISSSLPAKSSRAMASVYGNSDEIFSKSWSDLWEEDEEDYEEDEPRSSFEDGMDIERAHTAKPSERSPLSAVTAALDIKDSSRRSSTPRAGLSELGSSDSRNNSPEKSRLRMFSPVRRVPASAPQKYSPPSKRSVLDKWSALGNLRRGNRNDATASPQKPVDQRPAERTEKAEKSGLSSLGSGGAAKKPRSRERAGSWRKGATTSPAYQHTNNSGHWDRKGTNTQLNSNDLWHTSQDWRQHSDRQHTFTSPSSKPRTSPFMFGQQSLKSMKQHADALENDDIGDLEWVGGWNDLHL
ncbi:hypothetical protein MBLNU459_g3539t2 [Dothideomycetes sp. NU459]